MNRPSARGARVLAAAGVVSAASMLGMGMASAASAASATPTTPATVKVASPALQQSLKSVVWHPINGCIVCGLGGYDPIFNPSNPIPFPILY